MARMVGEPAGILGGGSIRAWMFLVSVNWATMPSTIRRITVVSTAPFGLPAIILTASTSPGIIRTERIGLYFLTSRSSSALGSLKTSTGETF